MKSGAELAMRLQAADAAQAKGLAAREAGQVMEEIAAYTERLAHLLAATGGELACGESQFLSEVETRIGEATAYARAQLEEVVGQLGQALLHAGEPQEGLHWLEMFERLTASGRPAEGSAAFTRATLSRAVALRMLNRFDEAEACLKSAYRASQPGTRERKAVALAYATLGAVTDRKAYAVQILEETAGNDVSAAQDEDDALIWAKLAMLKFIPTEPARAAELLERAISLLENIKPNSTRLSELELSLAQASLLKGDPQACFDLALIALARYTDHPNLDVVWRCAEALGLAAIKMRQPELAVMALKYAVAVIENLREARRSQDAVFPSVMGTPLEFVYDVLADRLVEQGRFSEAREVMSLKLSAVLADADSSRVPSVTAIESHALTQLFAALSQSKAAKHGVLRDSVSRIENGFRDSRSTHQRQLAQLNHALSSTRNLQFPESALADTLQINVNQSTDTTRVIASTRYRDLPLATPASVPTREINNLAFAFSQAILARRRADVERHGKRLYDLLLGPWLQAAGSAYSRLLICTPGALHSLPWAALFDGERYLAERYSLVRATVPSVDLRRKPRNPMQILGCASGSSAGRAAPLPFSIAEVNSLDCTQILTDQQGTFTQSGLAGALPRASVLHIAAHFKANPGSVLESSFMLGDGTELSVADFTQLPLTQLDMVVLSACESSHQESQARDLTTLSVDHLLVACRAQAIVSTLFRVSDPATAELMRRFYHNLRAGRDKDVALAQAQRALLGGEAGHEWRAACYWAAPVLSGNWMSW